MASARTAEALGFEVDPVSPVGGSYYSPGKVSVSTTRVRPERNHEVSPSYKHHRYPIVLLLISFFYNYRRVLISQDLDEICITVAEYDKEYVD